MGGSETTGVGEFIYDIGIVDTEIGGEEVLGITSSEVVGVVDYFGSREEAEKVGFVGTTGYGG